MLDFQEFSNQAKWKRKHGTTNKMKLNTKERNAIPTIKFAGPDRSYPVNDKNHAVSAKARATQAVNAGRMSSSEASKIKAKANAVLGHKQVKGIAKHVGKLKSS